MSRFAYVHPSYVVSLELEGMKRAAKVVVGP